MNRQQRSTYIREMTDRNTERTRGYVEGNTVRKLNSVPKQEPRRVGEREQGNRRHIQKSRGRAKQMSLGYIMFLCMAILMTVGICGVYIQLQSDINNRMTNIAALEGQLLELKTDNDAAMKRVETSVNLDEVKNIAMGEMGMVYPSQDQIVYFEVATTDYMNQYQDIPE